MSLQERPALALSGRTLVIGESGAVKLPTFTYYRARVSTVRLRGNRLGFAGAPQRKIIIRTSIGPLATAKLAVSSRGAILAGASGRGFAGPVVWCCTQAGEERVVYSDGRSGAGRPISVAFRGNTARALIGGGRNLTILERGSSGAIDREDFLARAASPFALGGAGMASLDAPGSATVITDAISAQDGPVVLPSRPFPRRGPAGRVTGLWMDGAAVVALVRRGSLWEIYRYAAPQARRLLLRTTTRPAAVAVGGGSVAAAVGRRLWAGRRGKRLRKGARATSVVRALAVDGNRMAWSERRGRGKAAVQRVRMGRVR